jgi:tetratricopeptide (TPR) repeat protein
VARSDRDRLVIPALLAALVVAVYLPVAGAGFHSDDALYVTANPLVQQGLSVRTAARSFTAEVAGNWHPLTVFSLALDARFLGTAPRGFHLANVAYHAFGVCAAFLALRRLTGAALPAAAVAAVFAVHPLHVESVAWVSGRKDVLSGLLFWLAVWAYAGYARRPTVARGAAVTLLLALGLMSKPILVVLPVIFLLLDFWPLARLHAGGASLRAALLEKLPWCALAAGAAAFAVVTQSRAGALQSLDNLPLSWRLRNAALAAVEYLRQSFWPAGLTVTHPFAHDPPPWGGSLFALVLLVALTAVAVRLRARRPALLVGWLWFAAALLPVAGIVQVGAQRLADRYMYLPLAGISIALVWGVAVAAARPGRAGAALRFCAAASAVTALAASARVQAGFWESGETIYLRALAVSREEEKWQAHHGLGLVRYEAGDLGGAATEFAEAIRRRPRYAPAYQALATVYLRAGNPTAALAHFRMALIEEPDDAGSHLGAGLALAALGRHGEAAQAYREALSRDPELPNARGALDASLAALRRQGRLPEAVPGAGKN